jgi:ATP-dependent 26S proteasome regulatory subunit
MTTSHSTPTPTPTPTSRRLPLEGWALQLARLWNSDAYTAMILHGNIFDIYPLQTDDTTCHVPLKTFLSQRIFPDRRYLLFYDISEGLTFGSADMQRRFFEWLAVYDDVESTTFRQDGPPREFVRLAALLKRFLPYAAAEDAPGHGVTLIIDFPEKIVPSQEEGGSSSDERMALVALLKWATQPEYRRMDVGVLLVTESAAELHNDLIQNPHICQIRLDLPDLEARRRYIAAESGALELAKWSDFDTDGLATRTAGLNLLRVQQLLSEAVRNGLRVTSEHVAGVKKRLIEEYCRGLVRFRDPKPGVNLDRVATHSMAKQRLRDLARLIRERKFDVLERGVLLPGRVGVGKSFLVDCFACECGLPVMELAEFRSKWVGDTEMQQMRILMTIRALGPVIVVVDEADAVFGTRGGSDGDSGVSGRVFAAFAAHLGDSSLRGRELWIAMTSRPDLLAIDMKRQGRFGLCIPLFPAQNADEVIELFSTIARVRKVPLTDEILSVIRTALGSRALTGSDVEAVLIRAQERAVLDGREGTIRPDDLQAAVDSFIDPLDPDLLALQELAAVLACSDRRYLPPQYQDADRAVLSRSFNALRLGLRGG